MLSRLNLRHVLAGVFVSLILIFTFQNCSAPQEITSASSSSTGSYNQNLPFAYDAKIDTIAHMSCSNVGLMLPKRSYFTYRVGAYNNTTGGLTLTPAFRTATRYYGVAERAQALSASPLNAGTRLNLALRSQGNLDRVIQEGSLVVGQEIEALLPQLDSPAIAGPLAGLVSGQKMNYFPGNQSQRLMEASLRFYEYENIVKETRDRLSGSDSTTSAVLAISFSSTALESDTVLRRPIAGSGFKLQFGLRPGYASDERRILNSVTETDLASNGQVNSIWNCSFQGYPYAFKVVRPEDKAKGLAVCNSYVDKWDTPAEEALLRAIRRVLRVEDWYVDLKNQCIMPRGTLDYCYGNLQGRTIQYYENAYGSASCATSSTTLCPHFVSVCIRQ